MESVQHYNYSQSLDLLKFTVKQSWRNADTNLRVVHNELAGKHQITYLVSLKCEMLVTSFQIGISNAPIFREYFEILAAQAILPSNRGQYVSMLKPSLVWHGDRILYHSLAFSQTLKLIFSIRKDVAAKDCELMGLDKQKGRGAIQGNLRKIVQYALSSIVICGYASNFTPHASQLTQLLNLSQTFKNNHRLEEAAETDILVSFALINSRRFIQASEFLKKVSRFYVQKYQSGKSTRQSRMEKSWIREDNHNDTTTLNKSCIPSRVLEGGKYLYKAAKIELLLAETISHPSLINEKLEAYVRANAYYGWKMNPPQVGHTQDIEEIAMAVGPSLMPFLIKMLYDQSEPLQMSSLKSIEFLFQTLGCFLASHLCKVLKQLVATYPSKQATDTSILTANNQILRLPLNIHPQKLQLKNKMLTDNYHHLLETLLSCLPQMNRKYLQQIYKEVIMPSILSPYIPNQLKLYMLRYSEKIMSICTCDLQITKDYIVCLLNLCQPKPNTKPREHAEQKLDDEGKQRGATSGECKHNSFVIQNMARYAQKMLEIIKNKILPKYDSSLLAPICSWLNQTLIYLYENELALSSVYIFNQLLDFVGIIYTREIKTLVPSPLEIILYFLNLSLSQQAMPFDKILQATTTILRSRIIDPAENCICAEIVERILAKAGMTNLSLKELTVLYQVLETLENIPGECIMQFLGCIPHSTHDQVYLVFDLLMQKGAHHLDKPLLKAIIHTLLDQYTVKGKAHQNSKQNLAKAIFKSSVLLTDFFSICFFNNTFPESKKYNSRKRKIGEHSFDTKMFKIDCELFEGKMDLFIMIASQITPTRLTGILSHDFIQNIQEGLKHLLDSSMAKLKFKGLFLLKTLLKNLSQCKLEQEAIKLHFSKIALQLLKKYLTDNLNSKLEHQCIYCFDIIFNQLISPKRELQSHDESTIDLADITFENFQMISHSAQVILRLRELIKIWPLLMSLSNSPWAVTTQALMNFLLNFFTFDLSFYQPKQQSLILQIVKTLLSNHIHSSDHIERLYAVKLISCLLGLNMSFSTVKILQEKVTSNRKLLRPWVQQLLKLRRDWDDQVRKYSKLIVELVFSEEYVMLHQKRLTCERKVETLDKSFATFNLQEDYIYEKSNSFTLNNFSNDNFDLILKEQELNLEDNCYNQSLSNDLLIIAQELTALIQSENCEQNPQQDEQYQQLQELQDEQMKEENEEEALQFQDLGIIELDQQEWGEEENQIKITQKLFPKKVSKLSPNLAFKHQRVAKRYQGHIEHYDKIIVDQLQGKISQKVNVETPILSGPTAQSNLNSKNQQPIFLQQPLAAKVEAEMQMFQPVCEHTTAKKKQEERKIQIEFNNKHEPQFQPVWQPPKKKKKKKNKPFD